MNLNFGAKKITNFFIKNQNGEKLKKRIFYAKNTVRVLKPFDEKKNLLALKFKNQTFFKSKFEIFDAGKL